MKIAPFQTEHFFAKYEFNTPHQLCNSDCESVSIDELLALSGLSLQDFGQLRLGYTESEGDPALRAAIAGTYDSVDPGEVLVLATPVEGIYLAARTLLAPGDEVVVLSPAYDALINLFEHAVGAGNVHRWTFQATAQGWALDFDTLDALLNERTRLVVVNFPHNPTGYLPDRAFLDSLVERIESRELTLFCDEMYHGLVHSGGQPIPSLADLSHRAVVLSGLSKTYGLPGLRNGWLVVRNKNLRDELVNYKFYTSICAPGVVEYLALAALEVREVLRLRNIERLERNLDLADAFFARWPEQFDWHRTRSGSTALVPWHVPSVSAVADSLAREAGILVHPAVTLGADDQHMRMGFGRDAFPESLSRFEYWLTQKT